MPCAAGYRAARLTEPQDEDRLLFAGEIGTARLCAATGCTGRPWKRGHGATGHAGSAVNGSVDGLARGGQPEGEQQDTNSPGEPHRHVAEVDLGLHVRLVSLREAQGAARR
ncbi:hypothetical protein OG535_38540 [Kitasatospora sp. NBC_00085]|uniref:hypothetical protein n=1 Tax=unclassified Kitasatospora TaxID=2633591 RepID=UPI003248CA12